MSPFLFWYYCFIICILMSLDAQNLNCLTDCSAACCRDICLVLSDDDAERLRGAGTDLKPYLGQFILYDLLTGDKSMDNRVSVLRLIAGLEEEGSPLREKALDFADTITNLGPGEEYYKMEGSCGYLDGAGMCSIYEDRPDVCRNFIPGGSYCTIVREKNLVEVPVTLIPKPDVV